MLVLSVIEASKDVLGAAGAKDKRRTSHAADDARAEPTAAAAAAPASGATEEEEPEGVGEAAQESEDRGVTELEASAQGSERGLCRRRRAGVRRDTPGWRAWEAR